MKKLKITVLLGVVLCCIIALVGCDKQKLASPTGLRIDGDSLILSWTRVQDDDGYIVEINGETYEQWSVNRDLSLLEPGEYSIRIKALGNGIDTKDSEWSKTVSFTREQESGLTYKLHNGNKEYMVTGLGIAGANPVVDDYYRGKPVTKISKGAFSNSTRINSIVFGANITTVESRAFYGCVGLTSVTFNDTLSEIGDKAFQSCKLLESVSLPDGVTVIPEYAFAYCSALKNVELGSNTEVIGESAFFRCTALEQINVPDSVKELGISAYRNCEGATSISIGSGVSVIPETAFMECLSAKTLTISNGVHTISDSAFYKCTALESVVIPDSVSVIVNHAFFGCEALSSVTLGSGLRDIGAFAFAQTSALRESGDILYLDNWLVDVKHKEQPSYTIEEGTAGIASQAFAQCTEFTTIKIPDSVGYIGDTAFYNCPKLTGVQIGKNVEVIGRGAFAFCKKLYSVVFDEKNCLVEIGDQAFWYCEALEQINSDNYLPASLENIGQKAFDFSGIWNNSYGVVYVGNWAVGINAEAIEYMEIPEGIVGISKYAFAYSNVMVAVLPSTLKHINRGTFYKSEIKGAAINNVEQSDGTIVGPTEIPDYMFYGCQSLVVIDLGQTIERIGRSAFYGASTLLKVAFPDSLTYIGEYAFYGAAIQEAEFGTGLKTIDSRAFYGTILQKLVIPDSVTRIGDRAFYRCEYLEEVTIGSSVESIGDYAFYKNVLLKSLTFSSSVRSIGKYAFGYSGSLETVTLNEGLEQLGVGSFYKSGIKQIFLPSTLTSVGKYSFRGCEGLVSVTVKEQALRALDDHVFYGCMGLTIYTDAPATSDWDKNWNSSKRPVVWGCVISDGGYVESVTVKDDTLLYTVRYVIKLVDGKKVPTEVVTDATDPQREGYVFYGWATEPNGDATYAAAHITKVPKGSTVYAVWREVEQPAPEEGEAPADQPEQSE